MGVVSNIIDALRRIGSPTQKSALKRQDDQLEGKEVLERRQLNIADALGHAHAFIATTPAVAETVTPLTNEQVRPIRENVEFGIRFFEAFGIASGANWTLDDLDEAFTRWQRAADKLGYSDEFIVEVLGAMFGEYCAAHLNMRWIKLEDPDGTTVAIEGIDREFRGFPYQTISKRIKDSEHGFFRPVFVFLKHQSGEARSRLTP
jgi:hypothetical protein